MCSYIIYAGMMPAERTIKLWQYLNFHLLSSKQQIRRCSYAVSLLPSLTGWQSLTVSECSRHSSTTASAIYT